MQMPHHIGMAFQFEDGAVEQIHRQHRVENRITGAVILLDLALLEVRQIAVEVIGQRLHAGDLPQQR